jgi:hypothetical protein
VRLRIRKACVHHLPQCDECRGVVPWTYTATSETHPLPMGLVVRLCLECWTDTRNEDA